LKGKIEIIKPINFDQKETSWKIWEVRGSEVYKRESFPEVKEICKELKVGDAIVVFGIFGEVIEVKVAEIEGKKGYAKNDIWGASLEFAEDGRDCWVFYGLFNLKGLEK